MDVLLLMLAAADPAAQQTVIYPAGFYARFAPTSALDMVRQTPGFALSEGADRRGFSGSGGNILIDGLRPGTKTATLEAILAQIPAGQVDRIEVLRGTDQAAAAATHAVVLNVVRRRAAGRGGWAADLRYSVAGHASPNGLVSWSGPAVGGELSASLNRTELFAPTRGIRTISPVDGAPRTIIDDTPRTTFTTGANLEFRHVIGGGAGRFTTQVQRTRYANEQRSRPTDAAGSARSLTATDDITDTLAAGADWERRVGDYDLQVFGLANLRRYESDIRSVTFNAADARTFELFQARTTDTGEVIARAVAGREVSDGRRIEAGLEFAVNLFNAALSLEVDTGGGPTPVVLPAANVRLLEKRAEGFLSDRWRFSGWTIESRLSVEISQLTQTGDTNLVTDLIYLKPQMQAARTFGRIGQVRFRLYRDVDQLSFEDFVSFGSILDDRIVGGNPDLRPQTQWRMEAGYDRRFADKGALSLVVYRAWASDVADVVPLFGVYDAPGNIGAGDFWGGAVKLALPLDAVIPGGLLNVDAAIDRSRVTDPVTGTSRPASGLTPSNLSVRFRQDIAAWKAAWGVSAAKFGGSAYYRLAEIDNAEQSTQIDAFAERTLGSGLKLRLYATNLTNYQSLRTRAFFAPDRNGGPAQTDVRDRSRGRFFGLEARGTF